MAESLPALSGAEYSARLDIFSSSPNLLVLEYPMGDLSREVFKQLCAPGSRLP